MQNENKGSYHLYQTLAPHGAGVRALATRGPWLITGSMDKQVKIYKKENSKYELKNEVTIFEDFIYACHVREDLEGFVVGCKNNMIYFLDTEGNPTAELEGHSGAVNSLSERNGKLISGSWDGTAIVWDIKEQKQLYKLEGHSYAVSVLALDDDIFITGSQDKAIRIWEGKTPKKKIADAHADIIREITPFGEIGFMSCSNDESIKLWTYGGDLLNTLTGHSSFVFSVTLGLLGRFFSGSEDKTVIVWKNDAKDQLINHPNTVWMVRCDEDGDVITACNDGLARVFSESEERKATQEEIDSLERESEMASSQGPSGMSEAQLQKLPNVSELNKYKGKNDGEYRIFKNGNTPEVYVWKAASQEWEKIGEALGQKTSSFYEGDRYFPQGEYDYVFEVDDESGIPKKLPYNDGDNPLEVAEKFLAREQLPKGYIEQITTFIRQNVRSKQGGGQSKPKQQSGGVEQKEMVPEVTQSKYFPYNIPILFESANFDGLKKKLLEFNEAFEDSKFKMTEAESHRFDRIIEALKDSHAFTENKFTDKECEIFAKRFFLWPVDKLMPVLDLYRMFLIHFNSEKLYAGLDGGLNQLSFICSVVRSTENEITISLCLKILANLFKHNLNRIALIKYKDMIVEALSNQKVQMRSKDMLRSALAAFVFNLSTSLNSQNSDDSFVKQLFTFMVEALGFEQNQDNIFKYLVAFGNILKTNTSAINVGRALGIKNTISNLNATQDNTKECADDVTKLL